MCYLERNVEFQQWAEVVFLATICMFNFFFVYIGEENILVSLLEVMKDYQKDWMISPSNNTLHSQIILKYWSLSEHRGHFIDTQILSTALDYAVHHVIRSKTKVA